MRVSSLTPDRRRNFPEIVFPGNRREASSEAQGMSAVCDTELERDVRRRTLFLFMKGVHTFVCLSRLIFQSFSEKTPRRSPSTGRREASSGNAAARHCQ
jgi:hypothetical protein